ncbi:MAG: histidine phosphotransferase family protein [Paracoccaceae bacterium]|uniref:histidine phosphotransferase family protein n=1 Tax=Seohaeicola saemankumensis TaxID=481181 RepID=UPI001E436777|nr:histidine phosphotransferase family protein [Seohaeicola saemankumensis]
MRHITNNLPALIGSRICHDLISPIGAIANGLELMQMSGATLTPEAALISESVENANARIRFFRVAYGMASAQQPMGRVEVVSILKAVAQGSRVSYHWGPLEDIRRTEVRLAFLAAQCLESAMPYGGRITLARDGDSWVISGDADKLRALPALWSSLATAGSALEVSASEVQFALLPVLLEEAGRTIRLQMTDQSIMMQF